MKFGINYNLVYNLFRKLDINYLKIFLICFFILINIQFSNAQQGFYFGVQLGPSVSFNSVESVPQLPYQIATPQEIRISESFFGRYGINEKLGVKVSLKVANLSMGVKIRKIVAERNSEGFINKTVGGKSTLQFSPAHLEVGIERRIALGNSKSYLLGGIGLAYLLKVKDISIISFSDTLNYAISNNGDNLSYEIQPFLSQRNSAFLLNANLAFELLVGKYKKNYLTFQFQYNYGLSEIYKSHGMVNFNGSAYQVELTNRGSYAALNLGYKFALNSLFSKDHNKDHLNHWVRKKVEGEKEKIDEVLKPPVNTFFFEIFGNSSYYSFNYDRIVFNKDLSKVAIRLGVSLVPNSYKNFNVYPELPFEISYLKGREKHLELGIGYTGSLDDPDEELKVHKKDAEWKHTIVGRIGYRYQSIKGGKMLKIGFTPKYSEGKLLPYFGVSLGHSY